MNITASKPQLYTSAPLPANLPTPAELTEATEIPGYQRDDLFIDYWEVDQHATYAPATVSYDGESNMKYADGTSTILRSTGDFRSTVAAAREIARTKTLEGNPGDSDFGQAILQAADGSYYVALLANYESTDSEWLMNMKIDGNEHIENWTPNLKALVDAGDWVDFTTSPS